MDQHVRLIVTVFTLVVIGQYCFASRITKRIVELEWEAQSEAAFYEIEIYDMSGSTLVKSQKIPEALFKLVLPVGNYKFRSRYSTKSGEHSLWSEMDSLDVLVPVGSLTAAAATGSYHQVNLKSKTAPVSIDWNMLPGINSYNVEVTDKNGKVIYARKTTGSPLNLSLGPGEYKFIVTPFDEYGNSGEPSEPSAPIVVSRAKLPPPELSIETGEKAHSTNFQVGRIEELENPNFDKIVDNFKSLSWKVFPGSTLEGHLFYRRIFSKNWLPVKLAESINKSPWKPPNSLAPGEYQLVVRTIVTDAEPSDPRYFFFRIKPLLIKSEMANTTVSVW